MKMDQQREQWIRDAMRASSIGALLAWRSEELVMLTGYLPHWGLSFCLYPLDGRPVLYVPELEPRDGLPVSVVVKTFPWGAPGESDPWGQLSRLIKQDVGQRVVAMRHASAGGALPSNPAELPPIPVGFIADLSLNAADGANVFERLFRLKTAEEVRHIRRANAIALHGVLTFFDRIEEGLTEAELAAAVEGAIHSRTGDGDVRYARAWAFVHAGERTADFGQFNRSTGHRLQAGDTVCLELATCVDGYWSDLSRTGVVGEPSDAHQRIVLAVQEAQEAAIAVIRAGIAATNVDRAARSVMDSHGLGRFFNHATGHPVGFRYHDYGPVLAPGNTTRLEAGMVLTVEPGAYGEELGRGCRIEENVLVTDEGAEVLSYDPD